jgi:hypothetical protein
MCHVIFNHIGNLDDDRRVTFGILKYLGVECSKGGETTKFDRSYRHELDGVKLTSKITCKHQKSQFQGLFLDFVLFSGSTLQSSKE